MPKTDFTTRRAGRYDPQIDTDHDLCSSIRLPVHFFAAREDSGAAGCVRRFGDPVGVGCDDLRLFPGAAPPAIESEPFGLGANPLPALCSSAPSDYSVFNAIGCGHAALRNLWISAIPSSYSHSIVAGGLLEMSYTTRFTPATSLMMRVEICASTAYGIRAQSAVMKSCVSTARMATTLS